MKNNIKALTKGLSIVAMAAVLAACGGGGGGDDDVKVVSYSAYLPNSLGQSFDRLVDFDTRDGKGSVVIEGVEQTYTLNTADTVSYTHLTLPTI